jgi:DNA repair protein RecO (recombination protein O)
VPVRDTEAMVLRSQPLGESDRIVTFLTRAAGKVRAVAKGARRSRRRFGSALEPLSLVRLRYFEREGADLARIETTDLLESFYDLQEEPERAAVLACMAEVADAFSREQQEDEPYFRLLRAVLRGVRGGLGLAWAARYFEIWTLRLHGVLPPLFSCARCGRDLARSGGLYDRREGLVLCRSCASPTPARAVTLPPAAVAAAAAILKSAPVDLAGRPSQARALAPLQDLAEVIFFDLNDRPFRSYEILRALRGGSGDASSEDR